MTDPLLRDGRLLPRTYAEAVRLLGGEAPPDLERSGPGWRVRWRPGATLAEGRPPWVEEPSRLDPAVITVRMEACHACPHHVPAMDRCRLCGCAFVVAERARSRVARCPEGRW